MNADTILKFGLGLIVVIFLMYLIEGLGGENAANGFVVVLLLGIAVFHSAGLTAFASDISARLKNTPAAQAYGSPY